MKYIEEIEVIKKRMVVRDKTDSPCAVANLVREYLKGDEREHVVVLLLDNKNQVGKIHTVSIGTVKESMVHPREIFRAAIVFNASAIIMAHNHPSGSTVPSSEDISCVQKLKTAGEIIGIQLLDSVIVGDGYYSMKEGGYI